MEREGPGFVTTHGKKVYGHAGTRFLSDFAKGAVLVVKERGVKRIAKIAHVQDDFTMTLATPMEQVSKAAAVHNNAIKFERVLSPTYIILMLVGLSLPLCYILPGRCLSASHNAFMLSTSLSSFLWTCTQHTALHILPCKCLDLHTRSLFFEDAALLFLICMQHSAGSSTLIA